MIDLFRIAGGVALMLFGVGYMRKGLDSMFGLRMGVYLQRLASNRLRAFFAGLSVGAMMPSSTALSLLAVRTVESGQMLPRQMLAVMLGANIGLTIMVQLISLQIDAYAPLLILAGVVTLHFARGVLWRGIGKVFISFGLIFLAMQIIRTAAASAIGDPNGDVAKIIFIIEKYPVPLACLAAAITMILQSSTAMIGLVIGVSAIGPDPLAIAIPAVLGANVGLAATTLSIAWRQADPRNMAVSNFVLKLFVAVALLPFASMIATFLRHMPGMTSTQIANLHTGCNILVALAGLPLVGVVSNLSKRLTPQPAGVQAFGPKYLPTGRFDSVPLALGQSMREILRASEIVQEMLAHLWQSLRNNDEPLAHDVSERDDQVDLLDQHIKRFLTRSDIATADRNHVTEQMRQLRYSKELETIGDIIDKNLSELVIKKIRLRAVFSKESWTELSDFYEKVRENLLIADTAFATRDRLLAEKLLRHKEQLGLYEHELRTRHFARLNAGLIESHEISAVHLDIITHLKRINSCASHVSYDILESTTTAA